MTHTWHPTETPPPEEGKYVNVWIALRGGVIIPGRYIYSLDESSANYAGLWLDQAGNFEVDAQYWMYRNDGDPLPDPPQ